MLRSINFLRRYRDLLIVLFLLLLPVAFYFFASKLAIGRGLFQRTLLAISAPLQAATVWTLDEGAHLWRAYLNLVHVQQENARLQGDNAKLRQENAKYLEEHYENQRLRSLLNLQDKVPQVKMIFAEVIATSPTPLFRSLRINRGIRDEVHVGAAVVTPDGVVGRVAAASDYFADIMLLVDPNSSADVLVERTRSRARVRGLGGDSELGIEVQYLSRTAEVQPGDILITSGMGSVFPKGLRVGRVIAVSKKQFGLYQNAKLEPSVDFSRLETVAVIPLGWSPEISFVQTPGTLENLLPSEMVIPEPLPK